MISMLVSNTKVPDPVSLDFAIILPAGVAENAHAKESLGRDNARLLATLLQTEMVSAHVGSLAVPKETDPIELL